MATAEQIKALIRSHLNEEQEQFITTALQVAAHEARHGHTELAHEIRQLVDRAKSKPAVVIKFPNELSGLIISEKPAVPLEALVLSKDMKARVERIILEFRQQNKLKSHGLTHRRKILLSGAPGTGKTMTAKVLASELKQPLHMVQMDRMVTKFMGETSAKLRQIFDHIREVPGVYLFDEFDAIGGERSLENDVGEMRRVLNAFLQFIENDPSDNLIVAATNNPRLLDRALFRRFDDVLHYDLPGKEERSRLIANLLGTYYNKNFSLKKAVDVASGLSHAEIDRACRDAIKLAVLQSKNRVTLKSLTELLNERQEAYQIRGE
ncbi:AAA family ATPase [Desulfofundulus thermobenzoicus]|uniref:AAA family ATPase n=1 Tax=Desulfofundulus thermobenzoicus TaxID=29376 RepID=A0A6N7IQI3_9FIRM|nr:ATP-binding protein [Desulfofundulus thermobenzoicus]MQL52294.1 AAA family ATPase [Desulfofundulus thermobenzoicus]